MSSSENKPTAILQADYYLDRGLVVFTAEYHLRRGTCCGSGCRHCPYREPVPALPPASVTSTKVV